MDRRSKSQKALQVDIHGRAEKERSLRDTGHLCFFLVCKPCRDGVTTRSELTSSKSNAGEFEEVRYPERMLVVHHNKKRWEHSKGCKVSQIDYTNVTNAYLDPFLYRVQGPSFTLYNNYTVDLMLPPLRNPITSHECFCSYSQCSYLN